VTKIAKAITLGSALISLITISPWQTAIGGVTLSVVVIDYLLTLAFVGGLRLSKRLFYQLVLRRPNGHGVRTLIVGAGDAGERIVRAMLEERKPQRLPVGFVDDDPALHGLTIHGVQVLGNRQDIPHLAQKLAVQELLVAIPSAPSSVFQQIAELARKAEIQHVRVLPSIHQLINGEVSPSQIRDLQPEDLLSRDPVRINTHEIESFMRGKTVLVTGAAGSIGSELCRRIVAFQPRTLVALDHDETGLFYLGRELSAFPGKMAFQGVVGSVQDAEWVERVFARFRPAVVLHAAAYKHVGMMEEHPDEAVRNNVFGTRAVGEAACRCHVDKFVLISTDKAVNPTSVMGATKRLAELVVIELDRYNGTKCMAVRFGNVLGSRGSVVPIFQQQIQRGGPVTVTHPEMRRYFMTTSEATLLVLQAGAMGKGGEVFVLDMGTPIRIMDLAREMIRLAGLEPDRDIPIVVTSPGPGEKLFEDIMTAEEGTRATKHEKVFVANMQDSRLAGRSLPEALERLDRAARQADQQAVVAILR
jgi:FlaA1/EpsC-like NDP-sugar epimerase